MFLPDFQPYAALLNADYDHYFNPRHYGEFIQTFCLHLKLSIVNIRAFDALPMNISSEMGKIGMRSTTIRVDATNPLTAEIRQLSLREPNSERNLAQTID